MREIETRRMMCMSELRSEIPSAPHTQQRDDPSMQASHPSNKFILHYLQHAIGRASEIVHKSEYFVFPRYFFVTASISPFSNRMLLP